MHDTIIIGAGIAGMTAAIYAARKRMNFRIIAREPGGQFMKSGKVMNYPGITQTTGFEFFSQMKKQLDMNGIEVVTGAVKKVVRLPGGGFRVMAGRESYDTRTVIIATGSVPRPLGVPGEQRLLNKGLTYCSICDGPLFSGMEVAVVGGGNSALEAVDFMKNIASRVYVLVIGPKFTGHESLIENALNSPNVEVIFNAKTSKILGEGLVAGLEYLQGGRKNRLKVQGIIVEIGRIPDTGIFSGLLALEDDGHIIIDCQCRSSVEGIFAAGDCASGHEYQYVISAGQGAMALLKAAKYLAGRREPCADYCSAASGAPKKCRQKG
jgi:thioredoxin reductase